MAEDHEYRLPKAFRCPVYDGLSAGKSVAEFAVDQLFATGLLPVFVWAAGLVWLFTACGGRFRLLGWVWVAVFGLLAFSGTSRSGYLGPAYTWLFAADAVALVERLGRRGVLAWSLAALLLGWGALLAPLAFPVLPVERHLRERERRLRPARAVARGRGDLVDLAPLRLSAAGGRRTRPARGLTGPDPVE